MKQMEFIRLGGLSPVIQDRYESEEKLNSNREEMDDIPGIGVYFHSPPARKGIYAFLPGFIEMFLVSWKIYKYDDETEKYSLKKEFSRARRFKYSGKLWIHIHVVDPEITYYRQRGSWYETDTDSLPIILKKYKWILSKDITSKERDEWSRTPVKDFNSFIRAWKIFSKDEFEVFIERVK